MVLRSNKSLSIELVNDRLIMSSENGSKKIRILSLSRVTRYKSNVFSVLTMGHIGQNKVKEYLISINQKCSGVHAKTTT